MRKKIWIWNHYASDMYMNEGGRHYWFAENLLKKDYQPTIFSANTFHNKSNYIETGSSKYVSKSLNNIKFVFVKTKTATGNGISRIRNMVGFYKNLFPVVKEYAKENGKPDIIIASSVHPLTMVAGIQIAKKLNVPCVCEVRDLWPEAIFSFNRLKESSLLGKFLIKGEYWIYKNADALIFTKEGDKDYILERKWNLEQGGDVDLSKVFYINNGVDLIGFHKKADEVSIKDPDLEDNKFKVVYTGAIRPVNNINNILDAAKILKNHADIKFIIYGDGNQKAEISERIKKEKLSNVVLKGFVEKKYIPYILNKSSVNLLNYSNKQYNWNRGNSSNKLFEYMASGKPIISTVKMGYSIIEKYNCGIELENGTPEELSEAIIKIKNLSTDKYNSLGNNALVGASEFDFNKLTDRLIEVIKYVNY